MYVWDGMFVIRLVLSRNYFKFDLLFSSASIFYYLSPHTSHCGAFTTDPTQLPEFLTQNQVFSWCLHTSGMWRCWACVRQVQRGSAQFSSFLALSLNLCPLTAPGGEQQPLSFPTPYFVSVTVEFRPKSLASGSKISPFPILLPYMNTFNLTLFSSSPTPGLSRSLAQFYSPICISVSLSSKKYLSFFKDRYMFWFYLCKFYLNHHVFGAECPRMWTYRDTSTRYLFVHVFIWIGISILGIKFKHRSLKKYKVNNYH